MQFINEIFTNQILCASGLAWFIAQLLKIIIDMWRLNKFSFSKMFESGGMPSSHSSTVTALATSTALIYGLSSFEFAVSFILASIVMYDALGVRRETGKQAKLLNILLNLDTFNEHIGEAFDEKLKELVGHTPLQVLAGAILGIFIALVLG